MLFVVSAHTNLNLGLNLNKEIKGPWQTDQRPNSPDKRRVIFFLTLRRVIIDLGRISVTSRLQVRK
jgi:hypothetical protein